jgi:hypothetical protein
MLTRAIKTYNNMKRTRFKLTHTLTFFSPSRFFPLLSFSFCFYLNHTVFPPFTMFIFSSLFLIFIFHYDVVLPHCVFPPIPFFFLVLDAFFPFVYIESFFLLFFFSCSCCLFFPLSISILSSSSPYSPLGEF